ncbi:hypothetical protein [Heyndrickxia oleronia]|nr:hypothetical protein [Heyndrickxia oleronia]GIN38491.1 hypothetical protein J19TS1_14400 [Heyndrickxia oleronia]
MNKLKYEDDIKQPQISKETLKEMAKFFMKTSIPRILAKEKQKKEVAKCQ